MRKVILYIAASLDGCIARRDGSIDWLTRYDSSSEDYGYTEFYSGIDTVLMGRKTYEQVLGFGEWPYTGRKCYVFSTASFEAPDVEAVTDPVPFVTALKEQPGRDIWLVGGAGAIATLINGGLVDELILTVIPVILGGGIHLFTDIAAETSWTLRTETTFPAGLVQMHYALQR